MLLNSNLYSEREFLVPFAASCGSKMFLILLFSAVF